MSEKSSGRVVDKASWGPGPWVDERDRVEWEHAGLPCLALRGPDHSGHWCGYVAVPPGHPLHGKAYEVPDVEVHGGLTYAKPCNGEICHVPKPGEPDDVWWFGFDCAHAGDYSPALKALLRTLPEIPGIPLPKEPPYDHAAAVAANTWLVETYKTLDYVQREVNRLAEQLAAIT